MPLLDGYTDDQVNALVLGRIDRMFAAAMRGTGAPDELLAVFKRIFVSGATAVGPAAAQDIRRVEARTPPGMATLDEVVDLCTAVGQRAVRHVLRRHADIAAVCGYDADTVYRAEFNFTKLAAMGFAALSGEQRGRFMAEFRVVHDVLMDEQFDDTRRKMVPLVMAIETNPELAARLHLAADTWKDMFAAAAGRIVASTVRAGRESDIETGFGSGGR